MKYKQKYILQHTDPSGANDTLCSLCFIPVGSTHFKPRLKTQFVIPYNFINNFETNQDNKAFAIWLKLKSYYHNTVFIDYSVSKCTHRTGISPYLLRKYIPILIDKGWVRMDGDNLVLVSFRNMFEKSKNTVKITVKGNVNDIINEIYLSHIKKDYSQQKFMADVAHDRITAKSNRARKKISEYKSKSMGDYNVHTSYRRIASQCKVSLSKAHNVCASFCKDNIISIKTNMITLKENYHGEVCPENTSFGFVKKYKGKLVQIDGSILSII